eukprot:TRINITY_DN3309_c2_g1_i1.p1 TRINITY_DN3309_c2_g1~~TRINITY_DN3309_c2_g1_i1.p1  ORF type:complete len:1001 (+),score=253.63 TRINITY_DN3309_c2_g1_i1:38-3040(+)
MGCCCSAGEQKDEQKKKDEAIKQREAAAAEEEKKRKEREKEKEEEEKKKEEEKDEEERPNDEKKEEGEPTPKPDDDDSSSSSSEDDKRDPHSPGTETETMPASAFDAALSGRASSPGYTSPLAAVNPLIESLQQKKRGAIVNNANVQQDGGHSGIRFYTATTLCGGQGKRTYSITNTELPTNGPCAGLRVTGASPFWHVPISFSPATSYKVINDIGNSVTERYHPHTSDSFMMIIKGKHVTVKHGDKTGEVQVSPCHDQAELMAIVSSTLNLPPDYWGLRNAANGELLEAPKYSDLTNEGVYHAVGLEKTVEVHGDRRVIDWPRACPLACKKFVIRVPFSAEVEEVINKSADLLLPDPSEYEGRLYLTDKDGNEVTSVTDGVVVDLALRAKSIVVAYDGKEQKMNIFPGWTSTDVLTRIKLVIDTNMTDVHNIKHTFKGVTPTWKALKHNERYELEEADLMQVFMDDRDRGVSEMVHRNNALAEACKAFNQTAKKCKLYVRKEKWSVDEAVEVLYDEGDETDGFYKARVMSFHDYGYTVRFENKEMCPGVQQDSIYKAYDGSEKEGKVIVFVPAKPVTISCRGKADADIAIPPGMNNTGLMGEICKVFRLKKSCKLSDGSLGAYLRCRRTGSAITCATSMWMATVPRGIYDVVFKPKKIHVTIHAEVERTIEITINKFDTQADVLHTIKKNGNCGLSPAWVTYLEADAEKKQVKLHWDSLKDGGNYVMREANKNITVVLDPRITPRGRGIKQEMIVPPHIRALELWKVVTVNPSLAISEAWVQMQLPSRSWDTPSHNPVADVNYGGLAIVSGPDIEGPCLDLQALSFTAVRNLGYYCIKFPDKLVKVIDGDREMDIYVAPGEGHRVVCDRVKRAVGCSEGWVLMGPDGSTVVACDGAGEKVKHAWMEYAAVEAGGSYELFREITITVTGRTGMEPIDIVVPPARSFDLFSAIRSNWSVPPTTSLSLRNAVTTIPVHRPIYTFLTDGVTYHCTLTGDETKE